ncbi:TLC domain-containing protein [Mycena sanguinolenta]|uniref:TLC domain-containing protein n=1 Tax=Mycena sanguinolenta TaxID=230812 RepID=A0A8H6Y6X8_9AGAR|nr:TLC domain-containing protein [Mycena sanguinolenta]
MGKKSKAAKELVLTDLRTRSSPKHRWARTPPSDRPPPVARRPQAPPRKVSPWLRWVIDPAASFRLLLIPVVLYLNWNLLTPHLHPLLAPYLPSLAPYLPTPDASLPNPFGALFLLSGRIPSSPPSDPPLRQLVTVTFFRRVAKYYGIQKEAKLDRFGEQGYAIVYFGITGAWGLRIMSQLPTWWYRTEYFWIDYPHWDMNPELKRYYLMQMAYWCQQFIVLVLGLEKPRKDYYELVAHHIVTLWLVGWSYLTNLTLIGNAVYMSMDIPDMALAISKILNYLQMENAKVVSFAVFVVLWTYFRHYLNLVILHSVWTEFDLAPLTARDWIWSAGTYLRPWMRHQIFLALALLQIINLFWYFLIMRILYRTIVIRETDDDRSDDEGDDEVEDEKPKSEKKGEDEGGGESRWGEESGEKGRGKTSRRQAEEERKIVAHARLLVS